MIHTKSGNIRFLRWTGSAWATETVAAGGGCTLACDSSGIPIVAFSSGGQTKVATRSSSGWTIEVVDSRAQGGADVTIDPNGKPALSYGGGGKINYAHK